MFTLDDKNKLMEFLHHIQQLQSNRWHPPKPDIKEKIQRLNELQALVQLEDALLTFLQEQNFDVDLSEKQKETTEIPTTDPFGEQDSDAFLVGVFKRDLEGPTKGLWGGYLHMTDHEPIWLPEMIVRKINLADGAIVKAIPNGIMDDQSTRYYFELLKAGNDQNIGRIERLGYYSLQDGKPCVIDIETKEAYPLLEKDVDNYSLVIDQPVLFALSTKHLDLAARIVEALDYDSTDSTKNHHPTKKNNPLTLTTEKNQYPKILNGENILVISADFGKEAYKRIVEQMGGNFEHGSVDKLGKLPGQVNKADGVIIVWQSANHSAVEDTVKPTCQEKEIPMEYAETTAPRTVKEALERLSIKLQKKIKINKN